MVNVVGSRDKYDRWKPKGFEDYLTVNEVVTIIKRDRRRLTQLEKAGKLPRPVRVKVGRLQVRLYSPEEVKQIKAYFKNAKPGNPNNRKEPQ